ncbi:secreted protein [Candidatus Magnetomorum sp. HK-1]|nr:secreted protein [Candidatus Magnetomorum sp. HK-1]
MNKLLCTLCMLLLVMNLSGCATFNNAPRFKNMKKTSTMMLTCNRPYRLTQSCSDLLGATKKITINGYKLAISGNSKGDVVLILTRNIWIAGFLKVYTFGMINDTEMFHDVLSEVEDIFRENSISINKIMLLKSIGGIDGYLLELDDDGYSILEKYE